MHQLYILICTLYSMTHGMAFRKTRNSAARFIPNYGLMCVTDNAIVSAMGRMLAIL